MCSSQCSRAGSGERSKILSEFRMRARDYIGLAAFLAVGALAVWMGRS